MCIRDRVIGDACIDEFVYGKCTRLCPDAPVPVFIPLKTIRNGGMSKNVQANIKSLGFECDIMCQDKLVHKTRYLDNYTNHVFIRVDTGENGIEKLDSSILTKDFLSKYEVIIISDYNKGFITQEEIFKLVEWFDGPVIIDSKKKVLPEGAFIKINELESKTLERSLTDVIVTKGGEGAEYNNKFFPAEKVKVRDVVGAGDTFLAALTYGYMNHNDMEKAIHIANKAAAVAVSHPGTYVLTEEDVNEILH